MLDEYSQSSKQQNVANYPQISTTYCTKLIYTAIRCAFFNNKNLGRWPKTVGY